MTIITSLVMPCLLLSGTPTEMTRSEFARALAEIEASESKARVARRVGTPDRVYNTTCAAAMLSFADSVVEAWAYGVTRAGDGEDFAALGWVCFGRSGKVIQVYGSTGTPHNAGIGEHELRALLGHIDAIGDIRGQEFDPLFLIRAVNVLRQYDKQVVVPVVTEYERLWSPMSRTHFWGIALLLETLLEDLPSEDPLPVLGVASPSLPASIQPLLPRYPILIVDDVPLLLVRGYSFYGCSSAVVPVCTKWFLRAGPMRRHPLSPRDNPLNVRRTLMESAAWKSYVQLKGNDQEMVYCQLVRLVHMADIEGLRQLYDTPDSGSWDDIARELDSMGIQWNAKEGRYVVARRNRSSRSERGASDAKRDAESPVERGE